VRVTTASPTADEADVPDPDRNTTPLSSENSENDDTNGLSAGSPRWRPRTVDLAVCAGLTAAALVLASGLLIHPATRALALNADDQALVEWLLALGTRFWTGDLDLVTHLLNAPDGVNLMSNASMLTLGVVLTPVTLVFGAPASFAVGVAANLAATGIGWYLLFARTLRLHRAGAATGAAFCAYAPGMISQSNAHLHMTSQWLVPVIVWGVLRLARTPDLGLTGQRWLRRVVGTGLLLAALVSVQLFLGEEVLLLTAVTLALFCLAYALLAPKRAARALGPLAAGLAVASTVALVVLAHPLSVQFSGAQHVPNGPFSPAYFGADLFGFWSVSPLSWTGPADSARLVSGPAEYNTFLGVSLIAVILAAAIWLWRRPAVVAGLVTALVMCSLAVGPQVIANGQPTAHTGPYRFLLGLPVIDGALPTRFALVAIPIIGFVLATVLDQALRDERRVVRYAVPALVALALLPLVPAPLPTTERAPVPRFFTEGHWRTCVRPGGTLVPVPPPNPAYPDKMRWPAAANAAFAIPEGFFIGPYAAGGRASVGIYSRPTSRLLGKVELTAAVPPVTDADRLAAREDVAYWHASCLVVADHGQLNAAALRQTMEALYGPGQHVIDVTVWRVGPI
jgi:hypothetical protein